ncbi:MAG: FAD-dependent oxidoreductase [Thermodesulfobacteriota bacterium]
MKNDLEPISITADVLIIGGGLAGLNAAMGAAEAGARVVVADKGKIERSGDVGGGVDHFLAYLEKGGDWDTKEAFLAYVEKIGRGTGHLSHLESLYCAELPAALERLARIGNPLSRPDGTYYRTASLGTPGPYWINFEGKRLKPRLAAAVRALGVRVLDKVTMVDLLSRRGEIAGGLGFHIRTGIFYAIAAKAVIIATGNTNRLYENPRLNPFNTWLCPFDTGDGQVMAFHAGAALSNMEYMRLTLLPKGFAAPGFNALVGLGGRFLNSLGDYYLEKRHPAGNRAPRSAVVEQSLEELREGRGPLFVDCRHLGEADLAHLWATLGYDKDTLPDYLLQRGEDFRKKPVEISVSEGMQAGPTEVTGSGLKIDGQGASTRPGLFACGDAADHNRCVHGAVTGGYKAGQTAAAYAAGRRPAGLPDRRRLRAMMEKFLAPLRRREGYPFHQIEGAVRKIMAEQAGPRRTEQGLKTGLEKLARLEPGLEEIKAADWHELMRAHETRSIFTVGRIMTQAALFRKESRNRPYHYRLDHPETDDENWCGLVVVEKSDDGPRCSFERITYA